MSPVAESPLLIGKVRELCEAILVDESFVASMRKVDAFLDDDPSREAYRSLSELGHDLQHKQRAGLELGAAEVREFETRREAVLANPVVREFLDAQRALGELQSTLSLWIEKTIELGRLPEEHELESGGCCGGSCGCQH